MLFFKQIKFVKGPGFKYPVLGGLSYTLIPMDMFLHVQDLI